MDPYQSPKSESQYLDGGKTSGLLLFESAVKELVQNWQVVLTASIIPLFCSTLIQYFGFSYFQSQMAIFDPDSIGYHTMVSFGIFALSFPFYVLFATNCHRIILLGVDSIPNKLGLYWSHDQTRFLGWVIVLAIIGFIVGIPAGIVAAVFVGFGVMVPPWTYSLLGTMMSTYFEGRLGLVFPATAVGKRIGLGDSWRWTRGIDWAIFFALMIPIAITQAASFVLFEHLITSGSAITFFLQQVLFYPLIAISVAVLTIVYKDFGKDTQISEDRDPA